MSIDYGNLRFMAEPLTAPLSAQEQHEHRQAVRDLMLTTPFIAGLGIVFEHDEPDDVTIRLPFRADLTNDGSYFHGGVVASVMDTAGAAAAWSNHDFDKGMRASTVAMSIQYTGAAKRCDLLCHARTARRRKELMPRRPAGSSEVCTLEHS